MPVKALTSTGISHSHHLLLRPGNNCSCTNINSQQLLKTISKSSIAAAIKYKLAQYRSRASPAPTTTSRKCSSRTACPSSSIAKRPSRACAAPTRPSFTSSSRLKWSRLATQMEAVAAQRTSNSRKDGKRLRKLGWEVP